MSTAGTGTIVYAPTLPLPFGCLPYQGSALLPAGRWGNDPTPLIHDSSSQYNIYIVNDPKFAEAISLEEGPHRVAALSEWVQSLSTDKASMPILVGGGAVELYTGGAYRTGDLDFVGDPGADAARRLEQAGFQKRGRHWVHEEQQVFLEFPSAQLGDGETSALITVGPYRVLVIGLEELIVDRLAAWQFWNSEVDGINAFLLVSYSNVSPDEARLRELADAASVMLSLERLERFLAKLDGKPASTGELESWAKRVRDATE